MMTKSNEKLDGIFNITSDVISKEIEPVENEVDPKKSDKLNLNDITRDYEYSRSNIYSIIEKGQEAINGILELAQETESPRAYEVAGQLIKNVSDATEKLLDLQKKLKDLDEIKSVKSSTNVTNALFVGSTAELSKLFKNQLKNTPEDK